jgi:hypothetical protein
MTMTVNRCDETLKPCFYCQFYRDVAAVMTSNRHELLDDPLCEECEAHLKNVCLYCEIMGSRYFARTYRHDDFAYHICDDCWEYSDAEQEMALDRMQAEAAADLKSFLERTKNEPRVWIRRQWNDWRSAKVAYSAVQGIHWSDHSGGVQAQANRFYLHGYISCGVLGDQEFPHSCVHGRAPHRIKVCIVKIDNEAAIYEKLKAEANRPRRLPNVSRQNGTA